VKRLVTWILLMVEKIIKRRFVWPLLGRDVRKHCMSCELHQKVSKAGHCKVSMVERPIITENCSCCCWTSL